MSEIKNVLCAWVKSSQLDLKITCLTVLLLDLLLNKQRQSILDTNTWPWKKSNIQLLFW